MNTATETTENVNGAALRAVLRQVPSPVTVVTARSDEGQPFGITIGSFASVSLRPPLVSFNVSKGARTYRLLAKAERLAVHVLRREQAALAARFADPGRSPEQQFAGVDWRAGEHRLPCSMTCWPCCTAACTRATAPAIPTSSSAA